MRYNVSTKNDPKGLWFNSLKDAQKYFNLLLKYDCREVGIFEER